MPACVLRANEEEFDVDCFLQTSPLLPLVVFKRGEMKSLTSKKLLTHSGFNLIVSEASGNEVQKQIGEAIDFLKRHWNAVKQLKECPGVESISLDFGVNLAMSEEPCWPTIKFPQEILELVAGLGIELEISIYPGNGQDD